MIGYKAVGKKETCNTSEVHLSICRSVLCASLGKTFIHYRQYFAVEKFFAPKAACLLDLLAMFLARHYVEKCLIQKVLQIIEK